MLFFTKKQLSNKQSGLNLIELIISIAIIAIIAFLALPNFSSHFVNSQLNAQSNALLLSLKAARNSAINLQRTVHLCPLDNTSTSTQCASNNDFQNNWSYGWLIFADLDRDNLFGNNDKIIQITQGRRNINLLFNQKGRLRFFSDGSARSAGFYLCDKQQQAYRHIYLLYSGRSRINQKLTAQQKTACDSI